MPTSKAAPLIPVLLCLAAGLFAVSLNTRFYARNQPFYDSLSYHEQVHRVMTQARAEGVGPALGTACRSSTVCLPLVAAAFVGPFITPSRTFGIAVQIVELLVFCGTLWFYLHRIRSLSPLLAALVVTPFLLWRCLYDFNGGLSDFRMDLSLALLFATTVLWYLIATATGARWHFVALGIAAATAAVGCLWFFLLNYEALHYYYVVWNTDANAHLPLRKALRHAAFAVGHVGVPAAILALSIPAVVGIDAFLTRRSHRPDSSTAPAWTFVPDWRLAWIVAGARETGRDEVRFGTTHSFYLNEHSLQAVAVFDHPAASWDGHAPRIEGVALLPDATFAIAAEADWARVPGDSTAAKLAHLLDTAARDIDYLAIPDEATSRFIEEHLPFYVINRHASTLRERLLASGDWEPVSDPIRNGEHETVLVYRNNSRRSTP